MVDAKENNSDATTVTESDRMEKQVQASDEKSEEKNPVKKQDNPLLRMFEKMREKNVSIVTIYPTKNKKFILKLFSQ